MDLKEETILGGRPDLHWYYRAKALAMLRLLGPTESKRVLDVGSGSGFFAKYLLAHTNLQEGTCIDPNYPREWNESINEKPLTFRRAGTQDNADLVLMMDVLEHVDDDVQLVKEYRDLVNSGSRFLITVPAFPFLWSSHDVFLEHRRRYTTSSLQTVMDTAGLQVDHICYYFGFIFPLVVAARKLGGLFKGKNTEPKTHMRQHAGITNLALFSLCYAELPFMPLNSIAGLSVFCVAHKV